MERDIFVPSGFFAAPSQLPVNGSGGTRREAVGVGGKGVGEAGVDIGEAQADSTQSRRTVEKMRMSVNIIQRI